MLYFYKTYFMYQSLFFLLFCFVVVLVDGLLSSVEITCAIIHIYIYLFVCVCVCGGGGGGEICLDFTWFVKIIKFALFCYFDCELLFIIEKFMEDFKCHTGEKNQSEQVCRHFTYDNVKCVPAKKIFGNEEMVCYLDTRKDFRLSLNMFLCIGACLNPGCDI